jgi:hypothetical protein
MEQPALTIFLQNEMFGYKTFCRVLESSRWATVPQALFETYGKLITGGQIPDPLDFLTKYNAAATYTGIPGTSAKSWIDQDLRCATISILRDIFELGPIQMKLANLLQLVACTRYETRITN